MTDDHAIATALRDAARALRHHADNTKTPGMVGQSYKLGVQDAALILTRKADDLDPQDDTGTTDGDFGGGTDADRDDWDVPLGEGYEGPSILRTARTTNEGTCVGHGWTPDNSPSPSWSPRYGYPPAPKGDRAPIHGPQFDDDGNPTGQLPKPIDQHAPVKYGSDWQTGLVHGPRLGGYINVTEDEQAYLDSHPADPMATDTD